MGNREIQRGGQRGGRTVSADSDAIASRHRDQGGHRDSRHDETTVQQVTDPEMVAMFCNDIANGVVGRYPIFGLKLSVEMRNGKEESFPALYFHGTYDGNHPINKVVQPGFFLSVNALFRNPNKVQWKNAAEQALSLELLLKPEFSAAIAAIRNEQAGQKKKDALAAEAYLTSLQSELEKSSKPAKPTPPVLTNFVDIMSARWGTFRHASGAELLVCFGMHHAGKPTPIVVRVSFAPAGHVLEEMVKEKIFFFQNQLATGFSALVEGATLTPKAALSRTFCGWVADELSAIGIDTYKQKKGVATGVDSMAGVNADHAAELEDGPPIGRTLQAFRLVVDSEQEPQAPAIVVEKAAKRPTAQRRRAVKCTEASASA